jgi:sterol desaturase/sphingolipid hydroxylase (fatty acid hydroxylase superfamily)
MLDWINETILYAVVGAVKPALDFFRDGNSRYYWVYCLTGLAIAAYGYHKHKQATGFQATLLDREVWLSPSAINDYLIVVITPILRMTVLSALAFNWEPVSKFVVATLHAAGVNGMVTDGTAIGLGIALTLTLFVVEDFLKWLVHYTFHAVPELWEFHKVHHSAETLTPLTEWRQHPLEFALFPILIGNASCLVQGPMVWYFGPAAQVVNPMAANFISMAFWYTILHLRHSELPIYATGLLGKLIQAPAHHQVHHSTNPKHFDKNLGYCLSVWDWVFGTLYVPKKGEKFNFGLGHSDGALETVVGSLLAPFGRAASMLHRLTRAPAREQ